MLYTACYANVKNMPKDMVPISIAGRAPEWWTGAEYKKLAPKWKFFQEWKQNHDNNFYVKHFYEEVLSVLTPEQVIKDLERIAAQVNLDYKDIAMICYEKPFDFCHRHLVSGWIEATLDCVYVDEFIRSEGPAIHYKWKDGKLTEVGRDEGA